MINDLLRNPPDRNPTPRSRLREYFEDRSIAEMSICFWITALSSFMLMVLGVASALHWVEGAREHRNVVGLMIVLGGITLWLGFLVWLWISFVRIARGWGPERLGTPIFKYMQMGFIFFTVLTMLGHGMLPEDLRILVFVLLTFDFVIVGMAGIFLLLAWSARCRVPWRTYGEILIMVSVFVLQIILTA